MSFDVTTFDEHDAPAAGQDLRNLADELTEMAVDHLSRTLTLRGNVLAPEQIRAFRELMETYTRIALGDLRGFHSFPLPTGMGKTTSIVSWCVSAYRLGVDVSVAIASQRLKNLEDIRRMLVDQGIPDREIGFVHRHSEEKATSEGLAPATPAPQHRRFVLCSHALLERQRSDLRLSVLDFHGRPRDLLIWDESLVRARMAWSDAEALKGNLALLASYRSGPDQSDMDAMRIIDGFTKDFLECLELMSQGERHRAFRFPLLDPEDEAAVKSFIACVQRSRRLDHYLQPLQEALTYQGCRAMIRTWRAGLQLVVERQKVALPDRTVILDASAGLREVCRADPGVTLHGQDWGPLKRYDQVTLHHMKEATGRQATAAKIDKIVAEVLAVIRSLPSTSKAIIFCFKDDPTCPSEASFREACRKHRIRLEGAPGGDSTLPEVAIRTWGQETACSDLRDHDHVFLPSVLRLAELDMAAMLVGQRGDLYSDVAPLQIDRAILTDMAHAVYQAASRGTCRLQKEGHANPMHIYLMSNQTDLPSVLTSSVMPGLNAVPWRGQELGQPSKTDALAESIARILQALPDHVQRYSSKQLFKALGEAAANACSKTLQAARDRALDLLGQTWTLEGRSLVRTQAGLASG